MLHGPQVAERQAVMKVWMLVSAIVVVAGCALAGQEVVTLRPGQTPKATWQAADDQAETYLLHVDPLGPDAVPTREQLLLQAPTATIAAPATEAVVTLAPGHHVIALTAARAECTERATLGHCWSLPAILHLDLRFEAIVPVPGTPLNFRIIVEQTK